MFPESDRQIKIELTLSASEPEMLEKLDGLLRLGLISEARIEHICRKSLTCPLPEALAEPKPELAKPELVKPALITAGQVTAEPSQKNTLAPAAISARKTSATSKSSPIARGVQSLVGELSVRWLLFLGIFMSIVSSGVLAAAKWEQFPRVGQYLILFAYTCAFWLAYQWGRRQKNLRLTTQTLQVVTLLLVPVNFWAMDGFDLWQSLSGWIAVAIAAPTLTAIMLSSSRNILPSRVQSFHNIALSYLHWGWALPGFPLAASYLGIVGTAAASFFLNKRAKTFLWYSGPGAIAARNQRWGQSLALLYAATVLLFRGIFVAGINIAHLGLAIGIAGWLLAWLAQQESFKQAIYAPLKNAGLYKKEDLVLKPDLSPELVLLGRIGGALLFFGWLISFLEPYGNPSQWDGPWQGLQAIAVSFLALSLLWQNLLRWFRVSDFIAIFFIGLQAWVTLRQVIPPGVRSTAAETGVALAQAADAPFTVYSITLLPYVVIIAGLTDWLYRYGSRQTNRKVNQEINREVAGDSPRKTNFSSVNWGNWENSVKKIAADRCARTGDYLVLGLGIIMTLVGLANPTMRSLNLLASTLILATIAYRRIVFGIGLPLATAATASNPANSSSASSASRDLRRNQVPVIQSDSVTFRAERSRSLSVSSAASNSLPFSGYILVYLAHTAEILTVCSVIDRFWPYLNIEAWSLILLAIALVQWTFYLFLERAIEVPEVKKDSLGNSSAANRSATNSSAANSSATNSSAANRSATNSSAANRSAADPLIELGWARFLGAIEHSVYFLGVIMAGLSYWLLTESYSLDPLLYLLWFAVPVALSVLAWQSRSRRELSGWLGAVALILANLIALETAPGRLFGLGLATVLMLVNTRAIRQTLAAAITLGFGLFFSIQLLAWGVFGLPKVSGTGWFVVGTLFLIALVALNKWGSNRDAPAKTSPTSPTADSPGSPHPTPHTPHPTPLKLLYGRAGGWWANVLLVFLLVNLTLHSFLVYWEFMQPSIPVIAAIAIVGLSIIYRHWPVPSNIAIYSLGWSLELLAAESLGFFSKSLLSLAIANIVLGLLAQLLGDWWQKTRTITKSQRVALDVMPLLYGALGASLRWGTFTNWTGLITLGLALSAIGVGRRRPEAKPLVYLALIGVWACGAEIVGYQVSSLAIGDQLIALAALSAGIMYAYRILTPWLIDYLQLGVEELKVCSHLHWLAGSGLLMTAIAYPIGANDMLAIGTGAFLSNYAIMQGRHNPKAALAETWVYLGLLEAAAILVYVLTRLPASLFDLVVLWAGAAITVIAYFLYFLPWANWGWLLRPWQRSAIFLPIAVSFLTAADANPVSLCIAAGFYIFLAWFNRQIRYTYLSAVIINWLLLRWFGELALEDILWFVSPPILSVLYVAAVDPDLKKPEQRQSRHFLRIVATGILCAIVLFTKHWLVAGGVSIGVIFAGLALRTRAFLYVGTVVFLVNAFYQMVILVFRDSLLKWIVGLLVGIGFIWIAATFETRRQQVAALLQHWLGELETWE